MMTDDLAVFLRKEADEMSTQIRDRLAFNRGFTDGQDAAKHMSPADIAQRLADYGEGATPYIRGIVAGLQRAKAGARRGQGTNCEGTLVIRLCGPSGCGKSLVRKILDAILPLTGLERFVIEEYAEVE